MRWSIDEPVSSTTLQPTLSVYNAVCSGKQDTCELLHKELECVLQGEPEFETAEDEEDAPSREDVEATKIMEQGATFKEGRWTIPLPFRKKLSDLQLPDNRSYAVKRLLSVRNNLHRKPELAKFYIEKMKVLKEQYLEEVPDIEIKNPELIGLVWYLVHFCTLQVKPRVVYDGPAAFQG